MKEISFNTYVWLWMGIAFIAFMASLYIRAPYGRHISSKWGATIANRWGWVLMELPALLLVPLLYIFGNNFDAVSTALVTFWLIHYIQRTLIFPFQIKTKGKRMPLAIVFMAIFFNSGNGFFNGYWFAQNEAYASDYFSSLPFIAGSILFGTGMVINLLSDSILINLRKPGETDYKIPKGGLFKFISCPNFFGEIIEWLGFAIAVGSLPSWSFFVWTAANLIPRALSHHRWYKATFSDYPKNRKAVIPGLL